MTEELDRWIVATIRRCPGITLWELSKLEATTNAERYGKIHNPEQVVRSRLTKRLDSLLRSGFIRFEMGMSAVCSRAEVRHYYITEGCPW